MKPTKMRNKLIYQATFHTKSKQLTSPLSKDLAKKYGKRSVRVREGDSVKILRGEFKGVDGKISNVSIKRNGVAIEGIKKEKSKGDKFDIYIHTSNLVVSSLDTTDKWRIDKLQKGTRPAPDEGVAEDRDKVQESDADSMAEQNDDVVTADEQDDETPETQAEDKMDDIIDGTGKVQESNEEEDKTTKQNDDVTITDEQDNKTSETKRDDTTDGTADTDISDNTESQIQETAKESKESQGVDISNAKEGEK